MRRTAFLAAALVAVLFIAAGCPQKPSVPIKPIGEASTFQYKTETYQTMSTYKKGDIRYIFDWGDNTKFDTTQAFASGETTGWTHAWTTNNTFSVKALALGVDGKTSDHWSDPLSVTVGINHKPNAPDTIGGPNAGVRNQKVALWTKADDPDGDSVYIQFFPDIVNQPTKTNGWIGPVPSGTIVVDSARYTTQGTYKVVAFAKDSKGAVSDSSPVKSIEIGNVAFAWSYASDAQSYPYSPALKTVGNLNYIYAAGDESLFLFVDDGSGRPTVRRQEFNRGDAVPSEGPTLSSDGTHLFQPCDNGRIYSVSAENITPISEFYLDTSYVEFTALAINGNNVYVGRRDTLYSLTDNAGVLSRGWAVWGKSEIEFPPVVAGNGNVIFGNDSGVFCINPSSPQNPVWVQNPGGGISTGLCLDDASVYFGGNDGRLWKLDLSVGTPTMIADTGASGSNFIGTPIIGWNGELFATRDDGNVYCFSSSGSLLWNNTSLTSYAFPSAPCLAPDTSILLLSDDDVLFALSQTDGHQLWQVILPTGKKAKASGNRGHRARPYLSDILCSPTIGPMYQCIYVGAAGGTTFTAVAVDKPAYVNGLPSSPWPKYMHDLRNSGYKGGFWAY